MSLENLKKAFGVPTVVGDDDAIIRAGEFLTVTGAFANGKKTLIDVREGQSRSVRRGVSVAKCPLVIESNADRVAVVAAAGSVPHTWTVFRALAEPLRRIELSMIERGLFLDRFISTEKRWFIDRKVRLIAARVGLAHLLSRRYGDLSIENMQRVALGGALICDPDVICVDVDNSKSWAYASMQLVQQIDLNGTGVIYAVGSPTVALSAPGRLAVLIDGNVAQAGLSDALYDDPDTLAIAEFLSRRPLAKMAGELGADGTLRVSGHAIDRFRVERPESVIVALRPEDAAPGPGPLHTRVDPKRIMMFREEGARLRLAHLEVRVSA